MIPKSGNRHGLLGWFGFFESSFCDMVVKTMQAPCSPFDVDKFATPLLKQLRERGQKRKASQAFEKTEDALCELELAPRVKRVIRRPPPVLTIYVRRNTEKAYNAIMLEEVTLANLKNAVSDVYGTPASSMKSFELRCENG